MLLMLDSETTRERLRGRDAGFEPSLTRLEQQTEGRVYATTRLCARYACVAIYGNDAFNACLSVDPKATCRESALQKKNLRRPLCRAARCRRERRRKKIESVTKSSDTRCGGEGGAEADAATLRRRKRNRVQPNRGQLYAKRRSEQREW